MSFKLTSSCFKYSLEWWFTEGDKIWELIEDKFQYNKKYKHKKIKHDRNTKNSKLGS